MSLRSKEGIVTLILICAKIILYVIADLKSGFHWDELLHIEAGNHLAFGYADFPPMIGMLAWIQNLIQSESLFVNRFFIHLSGIASMLLTFMIVTRLGGKWKAVLIALLCILVSPLFGASHMLFLPVGFSQFFHLLAAYYLISYYQEKKDRHLYLLAISVGLGFLTKYLIGFFILSLGTCVILFDRALLGKKAFWTAVVLFVLIISPNLLWQIIHGFPVLSHFNALMNTDLNTSNLWDEIALIIKYFNPVILIISFVGLLLTAFHKSSNLLKLIGYALILQLLLILIANGKFYYIAPVILAGIGFGAVWMERWVSVQNWILVSIILVILVSGVVLLPHGVPFFTPEKYVKLYKVPETEDGRTPIFFDQFHTRALWPKVLNGLRETIENLPVEEQKNCVIWGKHYGYAGIADLYREEYGFPTAISHMGCYHDWMPALDTSSVYITTGEINLTPAFWYQFFDSVEEIMLIRNKYSLDYQNSGIRIYVCRGLKYNRDEIKGIIDKYYGI